MLSKKKWKTLEMQAMEIGAMEATIEWMISVSTQLTSKQLFFFFLERHNHLFSQIDNTYNSTLYFFKKNFMDILLTKMPNVISVIGVGPFYNYKTMKIK